MIWLISIVLAVPVAALHLAGVPLIWAVIIAVTALLAIVATAGKKANGPVAVLATVVVVLVLAAGVAVIHSGSAAARGPAVVTFGLGTYSSYGTPSFSVDATNGGESPATLRTTIRVRFVNDQTAQVITEVTEPVNVTIPAGQGRTLTYPAPQAVAGPSGPAVTDRDISVTPEDS